MFGATVCGETVGSGVGSSVSLALLLGEDILRGLGRSPDKGGVCKDYLLIQYDLQSSQRRKKEASACKNMRNMFITRRARELVIFYRMRGGLQCGVTLSFCVNDP